MSKKAEKLIAYSYKILSFCIFKKEEILKADKRLSIL